MFSSAVTLRAVVRRGAAAASSSSSAAGAAAGATSRFDAPRPPPFVSPHGRTCGVDDFRRRRPREEGAGRLLRRWFASSSSENGGEKSAASPEEKKKPPTTSSQHSAWVDFQRTITVDGFETGQTVTEVDASKRRSRGGRVTRKLKEREAELAKALKGGPAEAIALGGGEFPPLRLADEETQRLLEEAYAAVPPRAGKRGTNNLRRRERQWFKKRKYDEKKRFEKIGAHFKKMEKRSRIAGEIRGMKEEGVKMKERDEEYQAEVLRRWALEFGVVSQAEGGEATAAEGVAAPTAVGRKGTKNGEYSGMFRKFENFSA